MGLWKGFHFVTFVTKPSSQSSSQRVVQGLWRRLNQSCSTGRPWKVQFGLHQGSLQAPAFHSAAILARFGGYKRQRPFPENFAGKFAKILMAELQRYEICCNPSHRFRCPAAPQAASSWTALSFFEETRSFLLPQRYRGRSYMLCTEWPNVIWGQSTY